MTIRSAFAAVTIFAAGTLAVAGPAGATTGTLPVSPSAASAVLLTAETPAASEFEFAATHYVVRSCYFEQMNRQGATGPHKFDGRGKNKAAAERDADGKANAAAAAQGMKLKHCRTESHSSKR